MRRFTVEVAAAVEHDLLDIAEFVEESSLAFGDDPETARDRGGARVLEILGDIRALGNAPHQGTLREEIAPGLRQVTKRRAVIYFDLDATAGILRVLAVFYGGQDHRRHMLARMLGRRQPGAGET